MKLEEIVGYLPHGLKILNKYGDQEQETITAMLTSNRIEYYDKSSGFELSELAEIKLLLHPLSDLTKPITVDGYNDGKEFVPLTTLGYVDSFDSQSYIIYNVVHKNLAYSKIQLLYQWHFWIGDQDRFGKDIIDINTLEGK